MKSAKNPILIIDKTGLIGEPLSLKLSKEFLVVFVSRQNLDSATENKNIVYIPFSKKYPVIPDSQYSHIIFIDEEGKDLEFLPRIIKKTKDVNADFIFAQGLSAQEEYATARILKLCNSAKVVIFGDIFNKKLILRNDNFKSVINKFIYQAQRFGKMQVLGEGMRETYPVFLEDVVDGLIDLVFEVHKSSSLFYIFPKDPTTELSLAHMIQKINPEITVDFIKHDTGLEKISFSSRGKNLLGDRYPLAKRIRNIDIKKKMKIEDGDWGNNKRRLSKSTMLTFWALTFLLLSPFFFTTLFSFLGVNILYYAKKEIDKGNFTSAKSALHISQSFFYAGKQMLNIFSFQAKLIGRENNFKNISEGIDSGYKISQSLYEAFHSEVYFSKIMNGKSENPLDDFEKGESYLKNSIIVLAKAKAEKKIPAPILQNLEIINPLIKLLSSISNIMPNIFGMEGSKTYLILFQNNMELRPGGGEIGSYGILKFDMGKVTEFSMHDIYDADNQLGGHVEPPFALRRYLPKQHWYMRDSNFDVDFEKSALSSSNFLFIETEQKADGVIAIDASFLKNMLHVVGPVFVKDLKEPVDENNFYELIHEYTDKNSLANPVEQKDLMRLLSEAIMAKIAKEKISYLSIAKVLSDGLTQKHLLLTFKDEQNIFTVNGWSSSLWDERKNSEESINDFVGINEANLGLNKINYFIKRQVSQKVMIKEDGSILEELTINYKNESKTSSGEDYKNYLRIILPKNTKMSEVSIDDNSQKVIDAVIDPLIYETKNFKAPQGLEVEKIQEDGKAIFGFLVRIPAGEIVKVELKYTIPGSISGLNTFSYNLKLFKQPGIDSVPYTLSFSYPKLFNIFRNSDGVIREEGRALYSEKIVSDKDIIIDFVKK